MTTTTDIGRRYIAELRDAEHIDGVFSLANAQLGTTVKGKPYLRCLLGDKTGQVAGRMWGIDEPTFRRLPANGFASLAGETQAYQGELQIIIHRIDPVEPDPDQLRELLPATVRPPAEMFDELKAILATVEHPAMRALIELYLEDEHLMDAFRTCPAAMRMHHARLGGLLEHTLSLLNLASAVCPLYPRISRDLVLTGLLLHDIGKTRELVYDRAFGYSDRGQLVGHIVEGAIMLHDKAQLLMRERGVRLPAGALTCLQHIILSHHGLPEYGAAKLPSTPEAILVHHLDNIDAKMEIALEATRKETAAAQIDLGGNFTDKQWALGNIRLYKPDPLKD